MSLERFDTFVRMLKSVAECCKVDQCVAVC